MSSLKRLLPILSLVALSVSCREVEDEIMPVISFISPGENSVIDMPDTLKVEAFISDNVSVRSVMVVLADVDGNPVIPAEYRFPDEPEYDLTAYLPVTDKTLPGGSYRVKITVNDGTNSESDYLPVIVNEIPRDLQGYLAITAGYPFKTDISYLDPAFAVDTFFTVPKGYLLSEYSSLWDEFYFASSDPSVLYCFAIRHFDPLWEFSASLPRPVFTSLQPDHQLVFSTANADVGILNAGGMVVMRTAAQTSKTIQCMAADDQYIFAEMTSLSGNNREIVAFYRSTGGVRSRKLIDQDIISLQTSNGKVLMFSNSGLFTIISEFDPETTSILTLETFEQSTIYGTVKLSEDMFLILGEGQALKFDYPGDALYEFLPKTYRSGCYDDLGDRLFLVDNNNVDIYQATSAAFIRTLNFQDPVRGFHIVYNK
jgi:hypothetical protein